MNEPNTHIGGSPAVNAHALDVLEFPKVLEVVAGRATSEPGSARVRALTPVADRAWLEREHARVAAVRSAIVGDQPWSPEPLPDLTRSFAKLRVEGTAWSAAELQSGALLMRSSRRTRDILGDERRSAMTRAVLAPLIDRLVSLRPIEDAVERTIAEDGTVRDDASPELRRLRRELRAAEGELIRLLERAMYRIDPNHRVSDMSVTVRNGRFVIPVRREARVTVGGIVHDASHSGATLFVEPPAAVEFGNRVRELEADEAEEVERVLRELTDRLRPHREALMGASDALAELDSLHARARFANEFACGATTLVPAREGFAIHHGRHPLLLAQGVDVVPFDLTMEADERTLLVSGPNTGGKTVLLKAVGLISALAQSGIPAPAGSESRVAMFDGFFADIGDEQSIEASLSTFSAHLRNLSQILRLATTDSLVLVDELGSGTDPVEGAALGWAILEELNGRGTLTLATTHLGTLKELASQIRGVVNASLQFDAAVLAPTYRLVKGVPGRSYGLSIARRLALPEHVVARAEERMPQQERDIAALIEQLERKEKELTERERETAAVLDDARHRVAEASRRERTLRERERALEKQSRQDARRFLLDARAQVENTIRELRQRGADAVEEAGRQARQQMEQLAAKQGAELERIEREEANVARREAARPRSTTMAPRRATVEEGDWVDVATLGGKTGRVLSIRGSTAVVALGALKTTVPLQSLAPSANPPVVTAIAWTGDLPETLAASEIDVRGMRADEVEGIVMQALDAAVRADLRSLRIIHGKGTGALRERVAEMIQKDGRVKSFRLGAWNEGGAGVTVVVL